MPKLQAKSTQSNFAPSIKAIVEIVNEVVFFIKLLPVVPPGGVEVGPVNRGGFKGVGWVPVVVGDVVVVVVVVGYVVAVVVVGYVVVVVPVDV